jgi:hypothetical protein
MRIDVTVNIWYRPAPKGAATEELLLPKGFNTNGRTKDLQGDTLNGKPDSSTLDASVAQGRNASTTTILQINEASVAQGSNASTTTIQIYQHNQLIVYWQIFRSTTWIVVAPAGHGELPSDHVVVIIVYLAECPNERKLGKDLVLSYGVMYNNC